MVLVIQMEMCVTEPRFFLEKPPTNKNDQKWSKIAQKWGFGTF